MRNNETMTEFEQRLERLIRIPSVYSDDSPPFGKNVQEVLREFLKIGEEDGFMTENTEDYAGHIEFGEGEELFGILAHLDVVPAGNGWSVPPFELTKKNGSLYGRGVQDDKGPLIAAYMAMKSLKEEGFVPKKRVRLIAGTDEEREWKGIEYYFKKQEMPDFGFTPDAVFPVIHAEKGLLDFQLKLEVSPETTEQTTCVQQIEAGERLNMVPDTAEVTLLHKGEETLEFPEAEKVNSNGEEITVVYKGVSAHGSTPQRGENAILKAIDSLSCLSLPSAQKEAVLWLKEHLVEKDGDGLGIRSEDDVSGELTMNLGKLFVSGESWEAGLNVRYPVTRSYDELLTKLKRNLPDWITFTETDHMPSLFVPREHAGVQALLNSYRHVTGRSSGVEAIGGATYARVLKTGVAFGAIFPESPDTAHQADEMVRSEDMSQAIEIYKNAIYEWTKE
ncbi:dipeptidase PepV [Salimicrobium flavidum]|uniref:Succinyl-diaminopimelate desuccinylase n=1 Tax=Salimicrobium flavidum TaxID=570947 RepID=A0A1N7JTL0_9BACI|nr:dipeptidase PepV [Salimicrobium flavidum]SIS52566.1 succinyl-diaminopimelate desuccinylase [Salimicrobium flavidum]